MFNHFVQFHKFCQFYKHCKNIFVVKVFFYFSCFPSCLIRIRIPGESWREILNEPEVASDIDWKHPQPELTKQIQIYLKRVHFYNKLCRVKKCITSNISEERKREKLRRTPDIVSYISGALCVFELWLPSAWGDAKGRRWICSSTSWKIFFIKPQK